LQHNIGGGISDIKNNKSVRIDFKKGLIGIISRLDEATNENGKIKK
tara:strand:+ start:670 stop:807 length:138 start_codon:yes stop_codon:yes gene_type:complete